MPCSAKVARLELQTDGRYGAPNHRPGKGQDALRYCGSAGRRIDGMLGNRRLSVFKNANTQR